MLNLPLRRVTRYSLIPQVEEDPEGELWNVCSTLRELELHKEPPLFEPHCSTAPFILYLALAEFSRYLKIFVLDFIYNIPSFYTVGNGEKL